MSHSQYPAKSHHLQCGIYANYLKFTFLLKIRTNKKLFLLLTFQILWLTFLETYIKLMLTL